MTNRSSGEVFGVKALNLAVIGGSVLILLGVLWQPAPTPATVAGPTAQIEQVAKAPVATHFAG